MGLLGSNSLSGAIISLLTSLPGLLIALSFHELAHGYVAYLQGDNTAKLSGRLTIDPLAHIDPIGFLMLIIVGFGWAKPVPVNYNNLKNGRRSVFLVSIAGVATNFVLAFLGMFALVFVSTMQVHIIVISVIKYFVMINIVLGVFNLIPVPPLDGSKVLGSILPLKYDRMISSFERYGYFLLIILLITGGVSKILFPMVIKIYSVFLNIATAIIG